MIAPEQSFSDPLLKNKAMVDCSSNSEQLFDESPCEQQQRND